MPSTESSIKGTVSLDSTIGYNTTLRFAYSGTSDIDVNVTSAKGNNITVIKDIDAQVVKAVVGGDAVRPQIVYQFAMKLHWFFSIFSFVKALRFYRSCF